MNSFSPRTPWMLMASTLAAIWFPASVACRAQEPDSSNIYWVFLVSGKSSAGEERAAIEKMQAAHLENFGRLARAGSLLTAGPVADPERRLRGIVVLKAKSPDEFKTMFAPDPFIKNGFLQIEASEATFLKGKFAPKVTPDELEELRLVTISHVEKQSAADGMTSIVKALSGETSLRLACQTDGESSLAGVLIFNKMPDEALNMLLSKLPPIAQGKLTAHPMPLYLSKGAVEVGE